MLGQYQKHEKCFLKAIFTGGRKRKEEPADGVTFEGWKACSSSKKMFLKIEKGTTAVARGHFEGEFVASPSPRVPVSQ